MWNHPPPPTVVSSEATEALQLTIWETVHYARDRMTRPTGRSKNWKSIWTRALKSELHRRIHNQPPRLDSRISTSPPIRTSSRAEGLTEEDARNQKPEQDDSGGRRQRSKARLRWQKGDASGDGVRSSGGCLPELLFFFFVVERFLRIRIIKFLYVTKIFSR